MAIRIPGFPKGELIFSFHNGPMDGKAEVASGPPKDEELSAHRWWILTQGGKLGGTFWAMSDGYKQAFAEAEMVNEEDGSVTFKGIGPAQAHVYEITGHHTQGDDVLVECEYRGIKPPDPPAEANVDSNV